ncbi:hypothetical protein [Moorena sp. SIO4G3]|uniref:hypothetical protein n=1 Tax=Moorena sp. SIO4G3 TaxID=2607821 RepID=UPI00142C790D|nr:hypothetical protein [Moorena sp. SIO4G3]NEO76166.1 hypothetical protein [Moorena sp. SIO4G3]
MARDNAMFRSRSVGQCRKGTASRLTLAFGPRYANRHAGRVRFTKTGNNRLGWPVNPW